MSRRRLLLVAVVALAAVAGMWGYAVWSQYRVEQQLVGTWRLINRQPGGINDFFFPERVFEPDGTLQWSGLSGIFAPEYWSVHGDELMIDQEPQRLPHVVRPLLKLFGRAGTSQPLRFEVSSDRLVLIDQAGERVVYTRVPTD